MVLKLLLWNCRGWKNKRAELVRRAQEYDIVVLTETKAKKEEIFRITGFNSVRKERDNEREGGAGGVAIFVRKDIKVEMIRDLKAESPRVEVAGVRVFGKEKSFNLLAVYRRPVGVERKGIWNTLLDFESKGLDTIVLGDFNAHSFIWNCCRTDINGENLWEEMQERNMYILNDDSLSRIGEGVQDANLDLVFASEGIIHLVHYRQERDS